METDAGGENNGSDPPYLQIARQPSEPMASENQRTLIVNYDINMAKGATSSSAVTPPSE